MRELGAALRRAREELGLDLNALEERTKIRKRYLLALEEGDWSVLPGDVYARGFVRSYAEAVGLDGRALLQTYMDQDNDRSLSTNKAVRQVDEAKHGNGGTAASLQPAASNAAESLVHRPLGDGVNSRTATPSKRTSPPTFSASTYSVRTGQSRKRHGSRGVQGLGRRARGGRGVTGQVIAVVGVLVVLGGGLYFLNHRVPHRAVASLKPPSSNVVTPSTGNGLIANNGVAGNVYQGNANNTVTNVGGGLVASPNSTATSNTTPGGSTNSPGPSQVTQVTLKGTTGNQIHYLVSTNQRMSVTLTAPTVQLWVMTTADGAVIDGAGGETLQPGQSKAFNANHTVVFHIGNVPAAAFSVNGIPVKLPNVTQTVDIVFTKGAPSTANKP